MDQEYNKVDVRNYADDAVYNKGLREIVEYIMQGQLIMSRAVSWRREATVFEKGPRADVNKIINVK